MTLDSIRVRLPISWSRELYGMKHILLMMTLMVLVGCGEKAEPLPNPDPAPAEEKLIADPIVEKAVRKELKKPTGELTKADLEKVTKLVLFANRLTDVKGLEKLPVGV